MSANPPAAESSGRPALRHVALVLVTCAIVYWLFLGSSGFSSTEGHRVIPGWEMLETGDFLVTRMFEQAYLRKPPGMPWAVALSSLVFGQTEFGARAVSATSMTVLALLSMLFAARWFGRPWGVWAGLATALTPLFWGSGRAAEIEPLNHVATGPAVLILIEVLVAAPMRGQARARPVMVLGGAAAIILAALAKGPAGFAAIGAAVVAACVVQRSLSPLARPAIWMMAALPALVLGALFVLIQRAVDQSGQTPVLQGVSEFLWSREKLSLSGIGNVLLMPLMALLTALPGTLALLFVWPRSRGSESAANQADAAARAVALTCLLSLVVLAVLGVHNPRYAMPSLVFVPVLAGYVARGAAGGFADRRQRLAAVLLAGRGVPWLALLLVGGTVYVTVLEQHGRRARTSGREPGLVLGAHLPDGAVVLADQLIEARPEVLLYARRAAAAQGRAVRIRWIPGLAQQAQLPEPGGFLALRTDNAANELSAFLAHADALDEVARGRVHRFDYVLLRRRVD